MKIKHPYESYSVCNNCGGTNEHITTDTLDGILLECKTICTVCGFEDYWAHGHLGSTSEIGRRYCEVYGGK